MAFRGVSGQAGEEEPGLVQGAALWLPPQDAGGAAEEEEPDTESMLDNFVNFFYAGHETTTNQLAFTIMELGRHPEIVAKLQAEVGEVIGEKKNIVYEDIRKLKYLSQVLKEALRLYPPAVATLRWAEKENVIEGIGIPANTSLTTEAKVVMAKFLQRFDLQLVPPQSFRVLDAGTLRPLDEIGSRLKPRHLPGCDE